MGDGSGPGVGNGAQSGCVAFGGALQLFGRRGGALHELHLQTQQITLKGNDFGERLTHVETQIGSLTTS